MKCRFNFEEAVGKTDNAPSGRRGPVRDPFQVEETRAARAETEAAPPPSPASPEPGAPPEERKLGVGGFDEPPDWAHKPQLVGPTPDLDDVFAGKGLDVGGYQVGGETEHSPAAGPAVSDAYAIMTSSNALAGSDNVGRGRKKSKKSKGRKEQLPPQIPGEVNGLPPDLSVNPFGMPEDTMRGGVSEPEAHFESGAPSARQQQPRPQVRRPPQAAPPQAYQPPGPQMSQGAQGPPPMMGGPAPGPPAAMGGPSAMGMAPPPGMQGVPATVPPLGGPDAQPLGGGPARVRRPVPEAVGPARTARMPRAPRAPRSAPSIPRPNLAVLRKVSDAMTPRIIVASVGGLLVLFAVIYLLVGGNYFSNDARGVLEAAQRAMASLPSQHVQADILMQTEKAGTINTAVTADISRDRDLHAVYGATSYRSDLEFVTSTGKTYKRVGGGAWGLSYDKVNPAFTSGALFKDATGARLVNQEPIDGVVCDHVAFEASPDYVMSLFPGVDVTEATQVSAEIWVDPQQKYVRHIRLDATNLETKKLGNFSCHVEVAISGFGTPVEIKPPM